MAERHVAVITGGSRGIGAATTRELAGRGFDVAFTYRNKTARAGEVADSVAKWRPRVELLVLNASGGLERDLVAADPECPMRINRDARSRRSTRSCRSWRAARR
ncbi:MAG: SDR family NAD(P)-dependent oxidoreductase [Candidatus Limnocylindria bacterium]